MACMFARHALALGFVLTTPVAGWAQTAASPTPAQPPRLTISGGIGNKFFQEEGPPLISGSMEIRMSRFLLVQTEISNERARYRETIAGHSSTNANGSGYTGDLHITLTQNRTITMTNLLAFLGGGRLLLMAGGGFIGSTDSIEQTETLVGCSPLPPAIVCPAEPSTGPRRRKIFGYGPMLIGSVDVRLSHRLTAFVTARQAKKASTVAGVRWTVR